MWGSWVTNKSVWDWNCVKFEQNLSDAAPKEQPFFQLRLGWERWKSTCWGDGLLFKIGLAPGLILLLENDMFRKETNQKQTIHKQVVIHAMLRLNLDVAIFGGVWTKNVCGSFIQWTNAVQSEGKWSSLNWKRFCFMFFVIWNWNFVCKWCQVNFAIFTWMPTIFYNPIPCCLLIFFCRCMCRIQFPMQLKLVSMGAIAIFTLCLTWWWSIVE